MTSSKQFSFHVLPQHVDKKWQTTESIGAPLSYFYVQPPEVGVSPLYIQPSDVMASQVYFQSTMLQQTAFMQQQHDFPTDFILPEQHLQQTNLTLQDPNQLYCASLQHCAHPVDVQPESSMYFSSIDSLQQYGEPASFPSTISTVASSYSLHEQTSSTSSQLESTASSSSSSCTFLDEVTTTSSAIPPSEVFEENISTANLLQTTQELTPASNKKNRVLSIVDPNTREIVNREMLDVSPKKKSTSADIERTDPGRVLGWLLWLTKMRTFQAEFIKILDASEDTNLNNRVYGKKFIYFMGKVVRELQHIRCPVTDDKLIEIGVFRTNVLPSLTRNDNNYRRTTVPSAFSKRTRVKRRENISFGSNIEQRQMMNKSTESDLQLKQLSPRKSTNAWRPSRRVEPVNDAEAERLKYEKLKKEVRGLLNKITPSTYEILAEEFISKKCHKDQKFMDIVIDLIFDKAVEEPSFCSLYSDLCKRQVNAEDEDTENNFFCRGIITKCQDTFVGSTNSDKEIANLENQINNEALNETQRSELKQKVEFLKSKEKRRLKGTIRFIAGLYRHNLLISSIINWCTVELVKRYDTCDDVYIEYAVKMIENVGKSFEEQKSQQAETGKAPFERVFSHLSAIKTKLSNRVRFMIMDLEDLRKNKWVPRHSNSDPKTIEDVHKEIAMEQQIDKQERDAYLTRSYSLQEVGSNRKNNGSRYRTNNGTRTFTSNRRCSDLSLIDRRSEAALNSIQASCSPPRRNLNLKKCDDQQRLGFSRNVSWTCRRSPLFMQATISRASASKSDKKFPLQSTSNL